MTVTLRLLAWLLLLAFVAGVSIGISMGAAV